MKIKAEGRRQKSDLVKLLLAVCGCAAATMSWPVAAQEPMGRLFFTPPQRSSLDVARSQRARTTLATERTEEQAAPQEQTITYGGQVRRNDGKSTVWINGRPVTEQEAASGATVVGRIRADGSVVVQVPQSGRSVELKPGQSVELLSGAIEEAYSRKPIEPSPAPKPTADAKKGAKPESTKPDSAEAAKAAEREREYQDQQRLQDAIQALRDAGTLKPAPTPPSQSERPR